MSLLTATLDDVQPRGKRLPDGTYRVTVEAYSVQELTGKDGNTHPSFHRQYGSIRTKDGATEFQAVDGSTFKIGNRKLFKNSWIDHSNPEAAKAGLNEIRSEAIAAGLMQKPTTEQPSTDLPFESWDAYGTALVGREELVIVRAGKPFKSKKTGEMEVNAEVSGWVTP